jgi:lysozyme
MSDVLSLLMARLRDEEGTGPVVNGRLMSYLDTKGKRTIGYGRNITDRGISAEEADHLLQNDAAEVVTDLAAHWSPWASLDMVRRVVIADLYFNMRLGNPKGFVREFGPTLDVVAAGQYQLAATRMRRWKWYRDVGPRRADPLIAMMRTGVA